MISEQFKAIELTHLLSPQVPTWNGSCGFCLEIKKDYDQTFPVHKTILGAGKYIIENIANSSQLPFRGCYVIVLPLRMEGATESPVRAIGIIPRLL